MKTGWILTTATALVCIALLYFLHYILSYWPTFGHHPEEVQQIIFATGVGAFIVILIKSHEYFHGGD